MYQSTANVMMTAATTLGGLAEQIKLAAVTYFPPTVEAIARLRL